jgi:hypothetical protein
VLRVGGVLEPERRNGAWILEGRQEDRPWDVCFAVRLDLPAIDRTYVGIVEVF